MKATLPANRLAMKAIVGITTAAWIGVITCIAFRTGKGTFGGYLPDWVPLTTILLGGGGTILTLLTSIRMLFNRGKPCEPKELVSIWYGLSILVSLVIISLPAN
ncbi:hypothetical protein JIN84_21905 [Luteolibacter yonseiensis]|uniref:Uncharacterized protein n=1 Tax=Luteolibacter yonseiensis TaxID=1144680 RepID=A0A934R6P9_9BACT|nr:hypothetical protein [Luteolibacter yonseiensis]MBK1818291.1 hypothetical protein [Luteolibacter yonseiensis]